jgi:hypothetical protein
MPPRPLAVSQPWLMRLIMEDEDIREAYAAAVAEQPATPVAGVTAGGGNGLGTDSGGI